MLFAVIFTALSCQDKAKKSNTSDAQAAAMSASNHSQFDLIIEESKVDWKGFKPTGTHTGTIALEKGDLATDGGKLQSGTIVIDMSSINVTDLEGDDKADLEAHLKGTVAGKKGDFFNTTEFPKAIFEITSTESLAAGKTTLSGNLEMKGQKHNITFPVNITNSGDMMTIESKAFTIDRTQWGINYGSKSVFDNLGDTFINDEIELKFTVKAKKVSAE
jgi:polyisoprenoid-binding protein YceI